MYNSVYRNLELHMLSLLLISCDDRSWSRYSSLPKELQLMHKLHWSTAKKSSRISQLILDNSDALNPKMPSVFLHQVKFLGNIQFPFLAPKSGSPSGRRKLPFGLGPPAWVPFGLGASHLGWRSPIRAEGFQFGLMPPVWDGPPGWAGSPLSELGLPSGRRDSSLIVQRGLSSGLRSLLTGSGPSVWAEDPPA